MDEIERKQKLITYVNDQIAQADFRARAYIFGSKGEKNPTRNAFVRLMMHFRNFIDDKSAVRWITFPGLRGAGKTTLLAQVYSEIKKDDVYKLMLSLDNVVEVMSSSLSEIIQIYEEIIGTKLERLDKPLILFLDEVQYDPNWATVLKTIYDRSPKVMIFATGSSALALNGNVDLTRRTSFEKVFPMCFTEYLKIKDGKFEMKGLAKELREAIFSSQDGEIVYKKLQLLQPTVNKYWLGIDRLEIIKYMEYGSLPYMVKLKNEALVYQQISQTVDKIIAKDIPQLGNIEKEITSRVPSILYAVSESDTINVKKLSEVIDISRPTLVNLLDILEKTELLYRIYPFGSHFSQVKKPSKYLFASPAFRSMYFHSIGNTIQELNYRGKLMEDTVVGYLKRIFWNHPEMSITYDSAQGGADFILNIGTRYIPMEVGYGNKDYRQIINTMKKVKSTYGLCISANKLDFRKDINAVSVPFQFYLLM